MKIINNKRRKNDFYIQVQGCTSVALYQEINKFKLGLQNSRRYKQLKELCVPVSTQPGSVLLISGVGRYRASVQQIELSVLGYPRGTVYLCMVYGMSHRIQSNKFQSVCKRTCIEQALGYVTSKYPVRCVVANPTSLKPKTKHRITSGAIPGVESST